MGVGGVGGPAGSPGSQLCVHVCVLVRARLLTWGCTCLCVCVYVCVCET